METRWKHKACGYNLTKQEIRDNIEEGTLNKPSSLVIACPGCIEPVSYFDLESFIYDGNGNGLRISNLEKEEKVKEKIEVLRKKKFKFKLKRKDPNKYKERR